MRQILMSAGSLALVGVLVVRAQFTPAPLRWIEAGSGIELPKEMTFDNPLGQLGVLNADGPVKTKGHPFFEPFGVNGRACVTCHQPANGMSLSADLIRERWRAKAKDPLFAAIDGSNNPSLPQDKESSHSLLLSRGLFRVGLPWPPANNPAPESTMDIVRDPTGVNRDPVWGLKSASPTISVFRRVRPAVNLKYVLAPDNGLFNVKLGVRVRRYSAATGQNVRHSRNQSCL